jgi:hypothetical protein
MPLIGDYFYYKAKMAFDEWQTRRLFYHHSSFAMCDIALLRAYRKANPYRMSKQFLLEKGTTDPHQYGETPITTYWTIAEASGLSASDRVIELGCGRGRGLFFWSTYYGCKAHGIEWNPDFVSKAQEIKHADVTIVCEDMLKSDLSPATFIYLYGTCLSDACMKELTSSFSQVASGTKIVTVSEPLAEDHLFSLKKVIPIRFPWGKTGAYLHVRR